MKWTVQVDMGQSQVILKDTHRMYPPCNCMVQFNGKNVLCLCGPGLHSQECLLWPTLPSFLVWLYLTEYWSLLGFFVITSLLTLINPCIHIDKTYKWYVRMILLTRICCIYFWPQGGFGESWFSRYRHRLSLYQRVRFNHFSASLFSLYIYWELTKKLLN